MKKINKNNLILIENPFLNNQFSKLKNNLIKNYFYNNSKGK